MDSRSCAEIENTRVAPAHRETSEVPTLRIQPHHLIERRVEPAFVGGEIKAAAGKEIERARRTTPLDVEETHPLQGIDGARAGDGTQCVGGYRLVEQEN